MTILDRILGDDPPKKGYVDPFQEASKISKTTGFGGMLGAVLKAASERKFDPIPMTPYFSNDGDMMNIPVGSRTQQGLPPNVMLRKVKEGGANKYYLRMKDAAPLPVSSYNYPELYGMLESGNPENNTKIQSMIGGLTGGTSNTPGGSQYGFEDGIDGGGQLDVPRLTTYTNNYVPKTIPQSTIQAGTDTPFKPTLSDWRGEDVKLKDTKTPVWKNIYKPFEWNEFIVPNGRKRVGLLDMIQNFTDNVRFKT